MFRFKVNRILASKILILLLCLGLVNNGIQGWKNLSKEEETEIESQLQILNKPAVKTIQMEGGDLFDCVDINKQPAFDHPSLKDHKIKMKPSSYLYGTTHQEMQKSSSHIKLEPVECPEGTVPIRRTTKEDLIKLKYFSKFGKYDINPYQPQINEGNDNVNHYAIGKAKEEPNYLGGKASLNVYAPPGVQTDQFSAAALWVAMDVNIPTYVVAGVAVFPELYNDYRARLFTKWEKNPQEGCFDIKCSGFVQVSSDIAVGSPLTNVSTYGGPQYQITLQIHKENTSKDWWLLYGEGNSPELVGYWPGALFPDVAIGIQAGGTVSSPQGKISPAMGSGHFPVEGFGKAAYVRNFQVSVANNIFQHPGALTSYADAKSCYDVGGYVDEGSEGVTFYYGGPGGCK